MARADSRYTAKVRELARLTLGAPKGVGPPASTAGVDYVVEAFLAASRAGDIDAVIAVLAPDAMRRADPAALPAGRAAEVRGARTVAKEVAVFSSNARFAESALVNGRVGIVVAPRGRLSLVLLVTVEDDRIAGYEIVADSERLGRLELAVLDPVAAGSVEGV